MTEKIRLYKNRHGVEFVEHAESREEIPVSYRVEDKITKRVGKYMQILINADTENPLTYMQSLTFKPENNGTK